MKKLVGIVSIFIGLVGCSGEKDPFDAKSDKARNPIPPFTNQKPEAPIRDVVHIDTEEYYDFVVGRERTLTFDYRVTHPDVYPIDFIAGDFEEVLPGAVFDKGTKRLTWQPPEDFLSDTFFRRTSITLTLFVEANGVTEEYRKRVPINVIKDSVEIPSFQSISRFPGVIYEGESTASIAIRVSDKGSSPQEIPSLHIVPVKSGEKNGVPLVELVSQVPRPVPNSPTEWEFRLAIDLTDQEVTEGIVTKHVGFRVVSSSGIPSPVEERTFNVKNNLSQPEIIAPDEITFYLGENNQVLLTSFDPKKEGEVSANCSFGGSLVCECKTVQSKSVCTLSGSPMRTGRFSGSLEARNYSNEGFSQSARRSQRIRVNVIDRTPEEEEEE